MWKLKYLAACAFTVLGLTSAFAAGPAFVDAKNGDNANAGSGCPELAPCADLNTALSISSPGGIIVIVGGGLFGPIVLTGQIYILGSDPNELTNIIANPAAQVGCIGHLPASCGLTNNGYGVEIAAGANDTITLLHLAVRAASNGPGALRMSSGNGLQASYDVFEGGGTAAAVQLDPNNNDGVTATAYFAYDEVRSSNHTANSGAVEVKPAGNMSLALHFNHVQVHNSSFGIRTDGSSLSGPSNVVSSFISECEFSTFDNAAVNAFSTSGTGTVNAVFDTTRILNASAALKANGPQSSVILSNNTVSGNGLGVQVLNGATVYTAGNNIVAKNGNDVSGTLTAAPTR
jgi:hypothetical protein